MIRLHKLDEPGSLARNKEKWTRELLDAIADGNKKTISAKKKKYNQPDVKAQLKSETHDKCAYCESKVTVVAHGDIEHVTPKSIEPELTFEWENLTFACQKCNGKKSDKEGIVDPYIDSVNDHFFFVGPFLRGRTAKGKRTELELGLNRVELLEDRLDHLKVLADTIETIEREGDPQLKQLLKQQLSDHLETDHPEYICMKSTTLAPQEELVE